MRAASVSNSNTTGRPRRSVHLTLASTPRTVKSFRLFLEQPVTTPTREVADYSVEERSRLRHAFSCIASDYRRHGRIGFAGVGGFMCCILLAIILPKTLFPWFFIPVLIFWLVAFGSAVSALRLVCPGCSNEIEHSFGRYCPECGSRQLEAGGWFRSPHCTACGKFMRHGKGRHYKIRACTHCGLMLDEKGR